MLQFSANLNVGATIMYDENTKFYLLQKLILLLPREWFGIPTHESWHPENITVTLLLLL